MAENIQVLDHGYVRFIESWGRGEAGVPEAAIIEAARQSTRGSFRGWELDEKLLRFLFNSEPPHSTPFEFAGMTIEVQAPIFVFREWHRHRTQSYNEMSARYAPLPYLDYIPTLERLFQSDPKNKQSTGIEQSESLNSDNAKSWLAALIELYNHAQRIYEAGLNRGIPKEIARLPVPVARYSRMRASANLRNWLAFMTLRYHPRAQWEIQQFAGALSTILSQEFPKVWNLFEGKRKELVK